MNEQNNNIKNQAAAGTRFVDAEDLSWRLSSLSLHDVNEYIATHDSSLLVPISLVLELIDQAE